VGLLIPGAIILLGGFANRYLKIILNAIGWLLCMAFIALFIFEDLATITFTDWKYLATGLGFLVLITVCFYNIAAGFKQNKLKKL
jgi:hypothetical protein